MNRTKAIVAALVAAICFAWTSPASQAQSPSGATAQPATATMGQFMSNLNPMNWQMPSFKGMLPGQEDKKRIIKKKNGLVSDVKETASKSWQKTKSIFDPSRLAPSNLFAAKEPTAKSAKKSPGFFGSMFGPREDDPSEQIATATDFLALPKIDR